MTTHQLRQSMANPADYPGGLLVAVTPIIVMLAANPMIVTVVRRGTLTMQVVVVLAERVRHRCPVPRENDADVTSLAETAG